MDAQEGSGNCNVMDTRWLLGFDWIAWMNLSLITSQKEIFAMYPSQRWIVFGLCSSHIYGSSLLQRLHQGWQAAPNLRRIPYWGQTQGLFSKSPYPTGDWSSAGHRRAVLIDHSKWAPFGIILQKKLRTIPLSYEGWHETDLGTNRCSRATPGLSFVS